MSEIQRWSKWRHKKSGRIYLVLDPEMMNATNAQNGQLMVVYRRAEVDGTPDWNQRYAREKTEFLDRFEPEESLKE